MCRVLIERCRVACCHQACPDRPRCIPAILWITAFPPRSSRSSRSPGYPHGYGGMSRGLGIHTRHALPCHRWHADQPHSSARRSRGGRSARPGASYRFPLTDAGLCAKGRHSTRGWVALAHLALTSADHAENVDWSLCCRSAQQDRCISRARHLSFG